MVLAYPVNFFSPFDVGVADVDVASMAVIFAIGGLSLNVLLGYAGQISLGHQAFVGIGAFTSAYIVTNLQLSFWLAVGVAAVLGAVQAVLLGAVSLRLTGLYFALVTLAYGTFAEETLFGIAAITGGEGGKPAPRPPMFEDGYHYYYLCLGFLALVLWLDWRLVRSRRPGARWPRCGRTRAWRRRTASTSAPTSWSRSRCPGSSPASPGR